MTDYRLNVLTALADEIESRKQASPQTSYTAKLLAQGVEKCAKKLGEEAVELALASVLRDRTHITAEAADVLYHLLVLLTVSDVKLQDVMAELARRQGVSGIDERASRPKD
ncbi:MAG: phosphoribosyl-ATP diphosphatase [Aestuariivirga sp.]|uniref:phosphoribosyl-ATP diphosphatase n=1 Tax=Aestuariivirga sp. TaxID=2650926 RepID=UPI003019F073